MSAPRDRRPAGDIGVDDDHRAPEHPTASMPAVRTGSSAPVPPPRPTELADPAVAPGSAGPGDAAPGTERPAGRLAGWQAAVLQARSRLWPAGGDTPAESRAGAHVLFAVSIAFYVLYQLATRGRMIVGGSMWAEMGTNYYATTAQGWFSQLYATDVGYIPLPQRLFALLADALGVPPSGIPYVYTGGAMLLSGLLIGCLCLPVFRTVLRSDALRFLLVLALMVVPDFETRTFINFTYFSVVVATAVTALALVDRTREVPAWAWVLPVLVLSKPGVLAVVPAMVVAALVSGRRFRRIAVVSVLAAVVQAVSLARSTSSGGSLLQDSDASAPEKALTAVKFTLGFLGRLVVGPAHDLGTYPWMISGAVVLVVSLAVAVLSRSRASVLIPLGLALVFFTMVVNSFTFSAVFTRDMAILGIPGFDRRFIVAIIGTLLLVAGFVAAVLDSRWLAGRRFEGGAPRWAAWLAPVGALLFALWFCLSGWLSYVPRVNQPLGTPVAEISQWEEQAQALASAEPIVCVPLDPFGWLYGRNCAVVHDSGVTPQAWGWAALDVEQPADEEATDEETTAAEGAEQRVTVTVDAPEDVQAATVSSVALMVRPRAGVSEVAGAAVLTAEDDSTTEMRAVADIAPDGGLLQFTLSPAVSVGDVRSVTFTFDEGVSVGSYAVDDPTRAVMLWMGQPGPQ